MARFLDALCDDNLSSLIIEGKAAKDQLLEAWLIILSEYHELRGDGVETSEQAMLSRGIKKLSSHLTILDACVVFLSNKFSDSISDSLRKLGYTFRPSSADPIDYIDQLNAIVQKSKTKYVQLQQLLKQLETIMHNSEHIKPTREEYEKALLYYEEMQGATYDIEVITVSKYVLLEKKYKQKAEQIIAAYGKQ